MRFVELHDGTMFQVAETVEEQLAMQPEAKLRAIFAGDVDGTVRFHERMLDIDRRWDAWFRGDAWPQPPVRVVGDRP